MSKFEQRSRACFQHSIRAEDLLDSTGSLKWQTLERSETRRFSPSQGGFEDRRNPTRRFRVLFMRQQPNIIVTVYHRHLFTLKMTTAILSAFLSPPTSKHNIIISLASTFALEKCFKAIMSSAVWRAIGGLLFSLPSDPNSMFKFVYRLGVAYEQHSDEIKKAIIKRT